MHDALRTILAEKGSGVVKVEPGATVIDAVQRMNEHGIGALLVTLANDIVGIFTERDVLRRVVGRGLDPARTKVSEVMTREVAAVGPSVTVADAMAVMTERRCRHLPVVERGQLLGMVSSGDLTRWLGRGREVQLQQLVDFITGKYPA